MRATTTHLLNFELPIFRGFEGEENDPPEGDEDEEDEDEEEDEEEEEGGDDLAGLKSALRKERLDRRKLEKENKRFKKENERKAKKEGTDLSQAQREAAENATKAEKLAERYATKSLNDAIFRAATKAKAVDADDVIPFIKLSDIDWDQDEDDPTDIEIDLASVTAAVDKLKKTKAYLFTAEAGKEGGGPTGSNFGGSRNKPKTKSGNNDTQEDKEMEKYPALRNRSRRNS